jgi:hypothetical protein
MINVSSITGANREIVCTDNSDSDNADRGFQFRVSTTGSLEFNFIGVNTSAISAVIPTAGGDPNAFVANQWFHVALSYDGANASFYWTRVSDSATAANLIGGPTAEGVDINDGAALVLGNEGRNSNGPAAGSNGSTEGLVGLLDEVRISNVARTADQMMFTAVPEPGTYALMGLGGLASMLLLRRRK